MLPSTPFLLAAKVPTRCLCPSRLPSVILFPKRLTVALGFDSANVKTEVHGKITNRDSGSHGGFTITENRVDTGTRQIKLSGVAPSDIVHEGDRLRFESGAPAFGLVPGEAYFAESVVKSGPLADGTFNQSFRLRRGDIASLDARQVTPSTRTAACTAPARSWRSRCP